MTAEWYTPPEIVESCRTVMGRIDLDPATCGAAQEIVRAGAYRTEVSNGLAYPWFGRVLLNPPGGDAPKGGPTRSNAVLWWSKLAHEYRVGNVQQALFIGFSIEILQATQNLACDQPLDFPFCIPRERIKFIDHRTVKPAKMPGHANVIVYLPPREDVAHMKRVFRREFFKYGRCVGVE